MKRFLVALMMLLLFSNVACGYNCWSVSRSTSPSTQGSTLAPPPNGPTGVGQSSYNTIGSVTYVTAATGTACSTAASTVRFTLTPPPGLIPRVTIDGLQQPEPNPAPLSTFYTVSKGTKISHTISAVYPANPNTVSITTISAPGGYIEPSQNVAYNGGTDITITPYQGYRVESVILNGSSDAAALSYVRSHGFYTFTNVTTAQTLSATFSLIPTLTADIQTGNATILAGTSLSLVGSAIKNSDSIVPTYRWTATGGTLGSATSPTASFSAPEGTYTVTLTVADDALGLSDDESRSIVVLSPPVYYSSACLSCHLTRDPDLSASFTGSKHYAQTTSADTSCSGCHNPAGTLNHPFPPADGWGVCGGCHTGGHASGTTNCADCHDAHKGTAPPPGTHYNSVTTGAYPASYVTSRSSCSDCHTDSAANPEIRRQWASSAHAGLTSPAWTTYDFKTRSGCVRCHTTTGFIAYSSARITQAWGVDSDKTKEVLTCIGCHTEIAGGTVRAVTPARPFAGESYQNRDVGASNICMDCHSGFNNGQVNVASGPVSQQFTPPHYSSAGGSLHSISGYHFPGQQYPSYSSNTHRLVGMGDYKGTGSAGPCVACHMSAPEKHLYRPVAYDAAGAVTGITSAVCANCHAQTLEPAKLNLRQGLLANALEVLKAMLAEKGFVYTDSDPHFSSSQWGTDLARANSMGAAYNYLLILREPGAYAHNGDYAKKLISDSIDYLYNGAVTGSTESAISHLLRYERITPQMAEQFTAFSTATGCNSCHSYSSGSHAAHLESGFGCQDCHLSTAAAGGGLAPDGTAHLNGTLDVEAGPGKSFSYSYAATGGTCSSISCHNNGTAVWGGTLGCDGCHDAPPATASHQKHYGGSIAQAGYGDTGTAQSISPDSPLYIMNCGNCHPTDKGKHGNGLVEVELYSATAPAGSLKALNPSSAGYVPGTVGYSDSRGLPYTQGTCSNIYCHSSKSWTTPNGVPNYYPSCAPEIPADLLVTTNYASVTWGGEALGCDGCHANPPRTRAPLNAGAAGDSHSWISPDYGWGPIEYLHTSNMMPNDWTYPWPDPISCMYCHNDTVRQLNTYFYDTTDPAYPVVMSDVPIAKPAKHVNGANDVAFERQVAVPAIEGLQSWKDQRLTNATYDSTTKTCSNVACHLLRTNVKWGTPYKALETDCVRCHEQGQVCPDREAALTRQPSISSTPAKLLAAPGYLYSYSVTASEPGNGGLSYTLNTAPEGMTISSTGTINWTPASNQMGPAPVKVVVSSNASSGLLFAVQEFTVTVQEPQPTITSTPITSASAWKAYSYTVAAPTPSGMPASSFALTTFPVGMNINATSGYISWTPTDQQVGSVPVTVTATSGGRTVTQSFTIEVAQSPLTFTSTPVTTASTQVLYNYQVQATMPGATSYSYSLLAKPANMTINSATGLISWTPSSLQAGSSTVTVQVSSGGYYNRQTFTLVTAASPITITSTPVTTAKVGVPYSYTVTATMPGGGPFTFSLTVRPTTLMAIGSTTGVISWTPTSTYVGSRAVTVRVVKGSSSATQSFNIVVAP